MNSPTPRLRKALWIPMLSIQMANAGILFNGSNTENLSDPGLGFQFDAVARVSSVQNPTKIGDIHGSAIHLGNGYMLTANHVITNSGNQVTFDGSTFYQIDGSFSPTQVAAGIDLKVFKLNATPGVSAVQLYSGIAETTGNAYLTGWGVGRDATALGSSPVGWGGYTTSTKRWGINQPEDLINLSGSGYSYTAIRTTPGSDTGTPAGVGDDEYAVTDKDSGSAMFQNISGTWYLIGVATAVEPGTIGNSLFGDDLPGSANSSDNYFVRISEYSEDIIVAVPEIPSLWMTTLALFPGAALIWVSRTAGKS